MGEIFEIRRLIRDNPEELKENLAIVKNFGDLVGYSQNQTIIDSLKRHAEFEYKKFLINNGRA